MGTAFEKISKDNEYMSPTFEAFKENLIVISERRAAVARSWIPDMIPTLIRLPVTRLKVLTRAEYGMTSREVLIPAFIAAYTKSSPHKVSLETFPSAFRMMPNWRLQFDGLSKFELVQKVSGQ